MCVPLLIRTKVWHHCKYIFHPTGQSVSTVNVTQFIYFMTDKKIWNVNERSKTLYYFFSSSRFFFFDALGLAVSVAHSTAVSLCEFLPSKVLRTEKFLPVGELKFEFCQSICSFETNPIIKGLSIYKRSHFVVEMDVQVASVFRWHRWASYYGTNGRQSCEMASVVTHCNHQVHWGPI